MECRRDNCVQFQRSQPLYRVSTSPGGTPAPLTTLSAGEVSHRWPKFLPDGRTLLYYVLGTEPSGVYFTTLGRPGARRSASSIQQPTPRTSRANPTARDI